MAVDHYAALGLDRDANSDAIRSAYRRKASEAHPDREGGSEDGMKAVQQAYQCLINEERRLEYDATGEDKWEPGQVEAAAEEVLSALVEQHVDYVGQNIVESVSRALRVAAVTLGLDVERKRDRRAKINARRERIKFTGAGKNLLLPVMDETVLTLSRQIAETKRAMVINARCIELIAEYADLGDAPPAEIGYESAALVKPR